MAITSVEGLAIAPLGAGDLIDRTVRLYRRHFMTLVRAASPPVVVSALGSVLGMIGARSFAVTDSEMRLALYAVLTLAGWTLWAAGFLLFFIVMGGAARNLVAHLMRGEPVAARAIYNAVRGRFWGLLGATLVVGMLVLFAAIAALYAWILVFGIFASAVPALITTFPSLIVSIAMLIAMFATAFAALWLFFYLVGRIAYVPQVMMIEGRGVFAAVGRSAELASGNVRRIAAMCIFALFAINSALMLLLVPLGWYASLNGVNPFFWDAVNWPTWYAIGYQVCSQASLIVLAPVWMLGLSLLYVDERVRHEGYDIELMAAQRLGEIPELPDGRLAPLTPALADAVKRAPRVAFNTSTLGLNATGNATTNDRSHV
jgi:hypothetical protein